MPGRGPFALLGLLAFVVAFVGSTFFGWEFGGNSPPIATALGVAAAALAVGVVAWRVVIG